jgi:hypothetical protein
MNENQEGAAEQLSNWKRDIRCVQRLLWRLRYWLFLNVWCRHLYRPTMKILHLFHLHYMPPMTRMIGQPAWERDHWCQWCGLRGKTIGHDQL